MRLPIQFPTMERGQFFLQESLSRNAPFGFGKGRRDKTGQRSSCAVPVGFRVHRLTLSAKAVQQEAGLPRAFLVALLKDENLF